MPVLPASPDTRPLRLDLMFAEQRETIERVLDLVEGMADDAEKPRPKRTEGIWARPDALRTNRVVMLTGERGTAKTSLMLTLLEGWRSGRTGDWAELAPDNKEDTLKARFNQLGPRVGALPPLDFDPLPEKLHLLSAIVQALRPLVDRCDKANKADCGALTKQWRDLFTAVAVGWDADGLRSGPRDLVDGALDREAQAADWTGLRRRWHTFIDTLVKGLNDAGEKIELLIVPVDDLDLQTARTSEALHALRLLEHPRVAFLFTGHDSHLQHIEYLVELGEMRRVAGSAFEAEGSGRSPADWAAEIARSRVEKSVPEDARVHTRLLTLKDALDVKLPEMETLRSELEANQRDTYEFLPSKKHQPTQVAGRPSVATAPDRADGPTLLELVSQPPYLLDQHVLPIRRFIQRRSAWARDARWRPGMPPGQRHRASEGDDAALARHLLSLMLESGDAAQLSSPMMRVAAPIGAIARRSEGILVLTQFTPHPVEACGFEVRASGAEVWRPASWGEQLWWNLARELRDSDGWPVFARAPLLVWSVARVGGDVGLFLWRLPRVPHSPAEVWRLLDHTQGWHGTTDTDALFARWIDLGLELLGQPSLDRTSLHPETDPEWDAVFDALEKRLDDAKNDATQTGTYTDLATFLLRSLPTMGAREYGLNDHLRLRLLTWARRLSAQHGTLETWVTVLQHDRELFRDQANQDYTDAPESSRGSPARIDWLRLGEPVREDPIWEAIVTTKDPLLAPNQSMPRLVNVLNLWSTLVGQPHGVGTSVHDFVLTWVADQLNELARLCKPGTLERALSDLERGARGSKLAVPVGLWRVFMDALTGAGLWPMEKALPQVWVHVSGTGIDLSAMPTLVATRGVFRWRDGLPSNYWSDRTVTLSWDVAGLDESPPGPGRAMLVASLMMVQALILESGFPFEKLSWPSVSEAGLQAGGLRLTMPELATWIDLDVLMRRMYVAAELVIRLPPEIPSEDRQRWLVATTVEFVRQGCYPGGRGGTPIQYEHPDDLQRRLAPQVKLAFAHVPIFARWWTENFDAIVRAVGEGPLSELTATPQPKTAK